MNRALKFEGLSEFCSQAFEESRSRNQESRSPGNIPWCGGLSWEEAKQHALYGWPEGMEQIEKYRARILPFITQKVQRHRQIHATAGYAVDVGAFLASDPECFHFREQEERNYPGRIYKLVVSVACSAAIEPASIVQRGAMICALVDAMEYAGHRVELICNHACSYYADADSRSGKRKRDGWFEVSVLLKQAEQPADLCSLAFCLAHPAMLRRMMFSIAEQEGWADLAPGYGYPAEASDQGDLYLRELFSGTVPDSQAIAWVLQQLKELGVNLESDSLEKK